MTPLSHLIVTSLPTGFPANSVLFVRCSSVDLISPSKTPAGVCMLSVWIVWKFNPHLAQHAVLGDQSVRFFLEKELSPKEIVISNNKKYLTFPKIDVQNRFKGSFFGAGPASLFSRGSTQSINSRQQGTHLLMTERIMQKDCDHFLFKVERKFAWNSTFFHFN